MGAAASTAPADGASTNITNEAFVGGLRHLLDLAAEGYPRGVRSTRGRRNALLRDRGGDADAAAAAAAATASTLADDAFDTIVALVPYFGLPAGVAAPLWRKLRASLLLAAVRVGRGSKFRPPSAALGEPPPPLPRLRGVRTGASPSPSPLLLSSRAAPK